MDDTTDILFIAPPFSYGDLESIGPKCPPLGIAFIAAFIEQKGYKTKILDAFALDYSIEQTVQEINKKNPKVILVGSMTASHKAALEIMERTKKNNPEIIIICGGPHVTNLPESTILKPYVDYLVINEGEITTLELLDMIFKKNAVEKKDIKGIAYKENGSMKLTEKRPFIVKLDDLPLPAYHLLPMNHYKAYGWLDEGRRFTTMITSRGCPFKCSFCISSKNFMHWWRSRSAEKVFEEILLLYNKYGIRHIYFQDDEFLVDHNRIKKLADMILSHKLDLIWECLSRVNHIDEDLVKDMARAGCKSVLYGIETGYEEGFKKINKPITLEMVENAVKLTQKYNIMVKATFIIGFPWESAKEIKQTITFAKKLDADITFINTLNPYPGSYVYQEIVDNNLFVGIGDNWEHHVSHGTTPVIRTKYLSEKDLQYWSGRAYLSVYMRPKYVYRKLRQVRNFTDFKRNVSSGISLMELAVKRLFLSQNN
ncbi:MAG: radical SAM protein [Nanoarchaeota archaeon]